MGSGTHNVVEHRCECCGRMGRQHVGTIISNSSYSGPACSACIRTAILLGFRTELYKDQGKEARRG